MAPRSFRLVCGPGPGETLLDEGGPASIVGRGSSLTVMLTCECDERGIGKTAALKSSL